VHHGQHRLDPRHGNAEPLRDRVEWFDQVAGLVDGIDEAVADDPVDRIRDRQEQLLAEVIVQRGPRCDVALEA